MTSIPMCADLIYTLSDPFHKGLHQMNSFKNSRWFWKEVTRKKLLRFLEFSVDATLVHTAHSLLYAYTYSGTMEAFIRLSQGIFGMQSTITVNDMAPAVITLDIKNANEYFLHALAKNNYALAIEEEFAMATSDLGAVVSYDPLQFFRMFLTPGRILRDLTIKTQEEITTHAY